MPIAPARRLRRGIGAGVAGALVLSGIGCVSEATTDPLAEGRERRGTAVADGLVTDPDAAVDAALDDAIRFWQETYPDVYGGPFPPIGGGFWPYGPTTDPPPCGSPPPPYEAIADNAFYCPNADLIAWDATGLVPSLHERFGPLALGIVFAHEIGHAVQARAGVRGPTILLELQADCFAGAWTQWVEDGGSDRFAITSTALDLAVAGFLELRDGIGIDALADGAHGTAFDRVGAFQDGYDDEVERCASYPDRPPVPVERAFTRLDDLRRGGDLPLDQIVPLAVEDLEDHYQRLLAAEGEPWDPVDDVVPVDPADDVVTCGDRTLEGDDLRLASFWCEPTDTIYLDAVELVPALDQIGDFAVAVELARNYAFAAQSRLGIDDEGRSTDLHADCLTGAWAGTTFPEATVRPSRSLVLSPGDLDEAITAFLAYGGEEGTAFERIDAMRTGFFGGADACVLRDG